MSEEPPGENVTITRTGLVGQAAPCCRDGRTAVQASRSNRISFPVGGVTPWRAEKRHVIVRARIVDHEADRHEVEEPATLEAPTLKTSW